MYQFNSSTEVGPVIRCEMPEVFDFLFNPTRFKIVYGGRGGAKSRSFGTALIAKGTAEPHRILCCREIQRSIADSVKKLLDDQIDRMGLSKEWKSNKTDLYNRATGTEILFAGLKHNVDSIKSMEGITICWIEEAHTVSRTSWDTLIPTIRAENSEIWASFNPKRKTDPVYDDFVMNEPPPNSIVKKVGWEDNPWFPDVLKTEMEWCLKRSPDKYHHVWGGEPLTNDESKVFFNCWEVGYPPEEYSGTIIRYGADWGFSVDPSALIRLWVDLNDRHIYVTHEFYQVGVELDDLENKFDTLPDVRKWNIIADSARPDTIAFMRRRGFKINGATKGQGSVEDGIEFLKSFRIVVHPRCKHVIDELGLYSYKLDPHTQETTPVLVDDHNHCIDSLRYAVEPLMKNRGMFFA